MGWESGRHAQRFEPFGCSDRAPSPVLESKLATKPRRGQQEKHRLTKPRTDDGAIQVHIRLVLFVFGWDFCLTQGEEWAENTRATLHPPEPDLHTLTRLHSHPSRRSDASSLAGIGPVQPEPPLKVSQLSLDALLGPELLPCSYKATNHFPGMHFFFSIFEQYAAAHAPGEKLPDIHTFFFFFRFFFLFFVASMS